MRLRFEVHGTGHPLVVLHGLFGSLDNWQPLNRRFGAHFQVIAADLRNHGRSPHAPDMTYELMANDVAELLKSRGQTEVYIAGHSMGGKVAMQLALSQPELIRKLVVVDISPAAQPPRHAEILRALLALDLPAYKSRQEMEETLAPAIPDLQVRRFLLKSVAFEQRNGFEWRMGLQEIAHNYDRLGQAITSDHSYSGPALFLRGQRSEYLLESDLGMIRTLFPHARLHTIPNAGHWVHAEAPDAVYEHLTNFLLEENQA